MYYFLSTSYTSELASATDERYTAGIAGGDWLVDKSQFLLVVMGSD
jgi:hypothetical protein